MFGSFAEVEALLVGVMFGCLEGKKLHCGHTKIFIIVIYFNIPTMSDLPTSHTPPPTKITVLISGKGSNLGKLIEATQSGLLAPHRIIRVISNRKNAGGLKLAEAANIPTRYHNLIGGGYHGKGEKNEEVVREARRSYDADLAKIILEDGPDLVVCGMYL